MAHFFKKEAKSMIEFASKLPSKVYVGILTSVTRWLDYLLNIWPSSENGPNRTK